MWLALKAWGRFAIDSESKFSKWVYIYNLSIATILLYPLQPSAYKSVLSTDAPSLCIGLSSIRYLRSVPAVELLALVPALPHLVRTCTASSVWHSKLVNISNNQSWMHSQLKVYKLFQMIMGIPWNSGQCLFQPQSMIAHLDFQGPHSSMLQWTCQKHATTLKSSFWSSWKWRLQNIKYITGI